MMEPTAIEKPKPLLRWKRYISPLSKKWEGWCLHVSLPIKRWFFVQSARLMCREITYTSRVLEPLRYAKEEDQDWGAIDVSESVTRALRPFVLVLPGVLYEAARKAVKRAKAPVPKGYQDVLPENVVRWAESAIGAEMKKRKELCVDNYRVARLGSSTQMRRYRKQQKNGCCGSFDEVRKGPDGQKYLIGCNYGH